ncbi:MAG: hypothetical protein ABEJ72_04720 [Candidatus Aenigmatarchaeota archaeon]
MKEAKQYWLEKGVWPETEPIELYGPAVREPDEPIFMDDGGKPIPSQEALENAHLDTYQLQAEETTWAFDSKKAQQFIEHRTELIGR